MDYISTRNKNLSTSCVSAIVNGISKDGGLFVPSSFPTLSNGEIEKLIELDYPERAAYILEKFLTPDFSYEELLSYTQEAYSRFDGDPCPVVKLDDQTFVMELWHGPTSAFKDMALTVLPHLLAASRKKLGETGRTLILVATSGDTGKAALEGFKDVEGTDVIVFYPSDGVSPMQKMQMMTQEGDNVYVCGIKGNFDDAQNAVKRIFADNEIALKLKELGYKLSSANSINWGRLAPQIAYYISSYCDLVSAEEIENGDKVNFVVPSGNFGNILAGYYAMRMGLPINRLICASNMNNVLTDFFNTGNYDIKREFYKTMSPSMDILISSNLERLLFELSGRDDKFVENKMTELKEKGFYTIDKKEIESVLPMFYAGSADEEYTKDTISYYFDDEDESYLFDPHTAVAMSVYDDYYDETDDTTPTVIVSTASPYKFPVDVYSAVSGKSIDDAYKATDMLEEISAQPIPEPLRNLKNRKTRFDKVIDKNDIESEVISYAMKRN